MKQLVDDNYIPNFTKNQNLSLHKNLKQFKIVKKTTLFESYYLLDEKTSPQYAYL